MQSSSLSGLIKEAVQLSRECVRTEDPDLCDRLQMAAGDLGSAARERFHEDMRGVYTVVARKLELGEPLTPEERQALDMLLTGASHTYLRSENDLDLWRTEIGRLADELEDLGSGALGVDDLMKIQALCREAQHVVPDLQYYLREKARIERFKASAETIDAEEGRMLARVVRDMMGSARR